ncbi:hypothetical protein FAIPA1_230062 [Frankia sp. AiPs1]
MVSVAVSAVSAVPGTTGRTRCSRRRPTTPPGMARSRWRRAIRTGTAAPTSPSPTPRTARYRCRWAGGDGTFQSPRTYPAGPDPSGTNIGDVTGDGDDRLDVVVANSRGSTITVLVNTGGPTPGCRSASAAGCQHCSGTDAGRTDRNGRKPPGVPLVRAVTGSE